MIIRRVIMQLGVLALGLSAARAASAVGGSRALKEMGEGVPECDMAMMFKPTGSGDLRIEDQKGSQWDCSLLNGSYNYVVAATKEGPEGVRPDLWGQPYVGGSNVCPSYVKMDCSVPRWKEKKPEDNSNGLAKFVTGPREWQVAAIEHVVGLNSCGKPHQACSVLFSGQVKFWRLQYGKDHCSTAGLPNAVPLFEGCKLVANVTDTEDNTTFAGNVEPDAVSGNQSAVFDGAGDSSGDRTVEAVLIILVAVGCVCFLYIEKDEIHRFFLGVQGLQPVLSIDSEAALGLDQQPDT
jgi:hypothetical protein